MKIIVDKSVLEQALEALEDLRVWRVKQSMAVTALRAALAQEQAEPPTNQCGETCERAKLCAACARELEEPTGKQDLHVEPEQEPVAKVELMMTGGNAGLATRIVEIDDHLRERLRPGQLLYTAPPQRKPLTEEEIQDCFHAARNAKLGASKDNSKHRLSVVEIARAIERAHGIVTCGDTKERA